MTPTPPPVVVRVALPVPLYREFDYLLPDATPAPAIGGRVPHRSAAGSW
ncbi:MAG: hypothetical protein R3E84_03325 [Pseudomonadales bacterium]